MELINKDMMINDIITAHPYLAEYIMDYGVHCVGCGVSAYETLEEGFMGHGISEEEIDAIVIKLNDVIKENSKEQTDNEVIGDSKIFEITSNAAKKIKEFAIKEKKDNYNFRIRVMKGGCSGYTYMFGFDNICNADDKVFEEHDVKVLVDNDSLDKIKNSVLDYYETLGGAGFSLENPNASKTCGCGKSFR